MELFGEARKSLFNPTIETNFRIFLRNIVNLGLRKLEPSAPLGSVH